ncbi:hypothetical protein AGOR_G00123730 [Albula goreensis]|uniref:Uncharacterized protein n=1 Tax=Albula goreensis TaxID=1534307 RepID=A0A8T3DEP4_9TELE|nr:hypothetical protein AGOR_G00123730 [Albula goreensis]
MLYSLVHGTPRIDLTSSSVTSGLSSPKFCSEALENNMRMQHFPLHSVAHGIHAYVSAQQRTDLVVKA